MTANRDRVEHVITEQLNGQQLNMSTERLTREAQQELRNRDPHQQNEDTRLYNRMAAAIHLPPLALVDEHVQHPQHPQHPQHARRSGTHSERPHQELPVPPIPPAPGSPHSEAPITPPAADVPVPPTVVIPNDRPIVNVPGVNAHADALNPSMTATGENRYNPLALPGLDAGSANGSNLRTNRQGNGETTSRYTGSAGLLNDDVTFNSERTTDANGHLLHAQVEYSGQGSILVDAGNGRTERLVNPRSAETTYNPETHSYQTVFVAQNGERHTSTTNNEGRVTNFR